MSIALERVEITWERGAVAGSHVKGPPGPGHAHMSIPTPLASFDNTVPPPQAAEHREGNGYVGHVSPVKAEIA